MATPAAFSRSREISSLEHQRQYRLDDQRRASEVDIDNQAPVAARHLQKGLNWEEPCGIDQNIHPPCLLARQRRHPQPVILIVQVAGNGGQFAARSRVRWLSAILAAGRW
jgi:hypothetical protein